MSSTSAPPPGAPPRGVILAVDDAQRNLQLLGGILTEQNYDVIFATGGEAALERANARAPDLVLLDLMMPGMDGLEVCRRLAANPRTADIPVIFLTAAHDAEIAARALTSGAVDYIGKPFHAAELLARVRTHVELKQTRDELRRIIAQKNELMSAVAHDLKNPISTVRLGAMLLRDSGLRPPEPRGELVSSMIQSCDNALAFIQDRLSRNAREARLERLHIVPVPLESVLLPLLQRNLAAATAKQIALDLADGAAVARVQADAGALAQVLDNLVSNAIKFSPPGGAVTVDVQHAPPRGTMRIAVRDRGPGLTAEDRKHLFEPYRRLSAQPTGGEASTGLGLSIARELVERMQGRIGCDSVPGQGATFWIELPLAE